MSQARIGLGAHLVAATCCVTAACGSVDRAAPNAIVRDSAGVTIVENRGEGTWAEGEAWRLATEPLVDIGVADGPAEYQLFRAWDATRLRDERIVVVNGGTNELRFYDPTGSFLFAVGGEGEGPGEFQGLQAVWELAGDSLLAYDFFAQRMSVYTGDGVLARSFRVESPAGRQIFVRGVFSDRSLLVTDTPVRVAAGAASGMIRDSVAYFRYGPTGALIDTLGRFPFAEFYRLVFGDDDFTLTSPPFPRGPRATVAGDRFYFGASESWEIAVHARAGELRRLIRLDRANRPVTPEDVERFKRNRRERAAQDGGRAVMVMERMLAAVPFPETMPAYRMLAVDAGRNIWVEHYRTRWEERSRWTVFGPRGRLFGTVAMPDRFEVFEIGPDHVLGAWTDELGVEHVRLYSLIKP